MYLVLMFNVHGVSLEVKFLTIQAVGSLGQFLEKHRWRYYLESLFVVALKGRVCQAMMSSLLIFDGGQCFSKYHYRFSILIFYNFKRTRIFQIQRVNDFQRSMIIMMFLLIHPLYILSSQQSDAMMPGDLSIYFLHFQTLII